MEDLKIGDVVQLKSGGPKMTISDFGDYSIDESGKEQARCVWFDRKEKKSAPFDMRILKKYEEDDEDLD